MTTFEERCLQAAYDIGTEICRLAIWDASHGACNWMGRTDVEDASTAAVEVSSAAIGPHLYAGSAGVAWFLAELQAQTGEREFGVTALGAMRRSVEQLRRSPSPVSALSFYSAHLGVLWVLHRLRSGMASGRFENEVRWLVSQIMSSLDGPYLLDYMSGAAGAIAPLINLASHQDMAQLRTLVVPLADELVRRSNWDGDSCYWDAVTASGQGFRGVPFLNGLSHGGSGMALGLLEAYRAVRNPVYRDVAGAAFAHDDKWYVPERSNWVDIRMPFDVRDLAGTATCQTAWCHGAPGIALARIRAVQLDPNRAADYAEAARLGLKGTMKGVREYSNRQRFDATLCHGLAGLSDVLLIGGRSFDEEECLTVSAGITTALLDKYATEGNWPTGVPLGAWNPSLMLGVAGIGLHLLRCTGRARVNSALLPDDEGE